MRFILRLFGLPAVLLAVALLLVPVAAQFEANAYLNALADYIHYACWALLLVGSCLTVYNLLRVWRAYNGNEEDQCFTCGMPTSRKVGRYGPYFSCWNCGTNRAGKY